jgi:hypothetical protein
LNHPTRSIPWISAIDPDSPQDSPEFVESSWYLVVVGWCIDLQSAPELWEFTGGKMIFYDLPGGIWHWMLYGCPTVFNGPLLLHFGIDF